MRASDDLERFEVRAKGVNNFVSDVDIAAEKEIIYHLHKAYPEHAILGEEGGLLEAQGLLAEDLDELVADDLALFLGVGDALQALEEALGGVDDRQVHVEVVAEEALDRRPLALPEQAVVHEDAVQAVADRLVAEHGGDGGVDSVRQSPGSSQTRQRKFSMSSRPRTECVTSGWNWTPYSRRPGEPTTANSQSSEQA